MPDYQPSPWYFYDSRNICGRCETEWDGLTLSDKQEGILAIDDSVQEVTVQDQMCQVCFQTVSYDGSEDHLSVIGTSASGKRFIISTLDFVRMLERLLKSSDSVTLKIARLTENVSP